MSEQDDIARRLLKDVVSPSLPTIARCDPANHEFTDATVVDQLGAYVAVIYCVKCGTWSRLSV